MTKRLVNNWKLDRNAYHKIERRGSGRHRPNTFKPDKSDCNHFWSNSDELGTNTHCVYCGDVRYSENTKPYRSRANENQPSNRQVLHQGKPKEINYIEVRVNRSWFDDR